MYKKIFDNIKQVFMIQTLNKFDTEESYLNREKAMYEKPTSDMILKGKNTESFLSKIWNKSKMPIPATSTHHVLEVILRAIRQEKKVSKLKKK